MDAIIRLLTKARANIFLFPLFEGLYKNPLFLPHPPTPRCAPNNPTQLPTDIIIYQNQTGIPYGTVLNVNQSSTQSPDQGSIYVNPDGSIQSLYSLEYDAYTPLYAHQPTYEIQLASGSTPGNPNYGVNVLQNVPNYSNYYLAFEQNNLGFTGIQFSTSTVPVPWEYQPSLISILLFICLFVFRKLVVL